MNPTPSPPENETIASDIISEFSPFSLCLVPLLDALGWRGERRHLIEAAPVNADCMDLLDLLNTMACLRFKCETAEITPASIDPRSLPCLFLSGDGKASVLVRVTENDKFMVFDGSTASYAEIEPDSRPGKAYFFTFAEKDEFSLQQPQSEWFQKILRKFSHLLGFALLLTFALNVFAYLTPLFVKELYDNMTVVKKGSLVFWWIGILLFIITEACLRFFRLKIFCYISARLGNIVGNEIFRRVMLLPPNLTETSSVGAQMSRIRDFDTIREFFAGSAVLALFDLPFVLLLAAGMIAIGGSTAYVPLVFIVLFMVFGVVLMPYVNRTNALTAKAGSKKHEFIVEVLTKYRAVRETGLTQTWLNRYRDISTQASIGTMKSARLVAVIDAVSYVLVTGAGLATMVVGVMNAVSGAITLGALVACMMLALRILTPLRMGFAVLMQVGKIKRSIEQINRLMSMKIETKTESLTSVSGKIKGKVSFSQVSLRYTMDSYPSLLNVSFEAGQGETVVIVGHDGAGKTTLFKLILGMYQPQAGRVIIDERNIRQMESAIIRQAIAYAPQNPDFFTGSIAENLRLANPVATDEEIKWACALNLILEDIADLPEQFDTRISTLSDTSEDTGKLSASLMQRLNFARAFIKKSPIMLIDEPEHGLDAKQIETFIRVLKRIKGSSTLFIATHNQAFFEIADKVLWLDGGRVRMFAPPAEVMKHYLRK